jgi:hypothetical protein
MVLFLTFDFQACMDTNLEVFLMLDWFFYEAHQKGRNAGSVNIAS